MQGWEWLIKPKTPYTRGFVIRVLIKACVLFILCNFAFARFEIGLWLNRLTLAGLVTPARERLPYAENSDQSYNLSPDDLAALFRTHEIRFVPRADRGVGYRVAVIGDSSVWGVLLDNEDTLTGILNRRDFDLPGDRPYQFFNLGYPIQSLTKDALLLDYAVQNFQPDMIIWLVTLEAFAPDQQLAPMIVRQNQSAVEALIQRFGLQTAPDNPQFIRRGLLNTTIIEDRRRIADWLRLELYGFTYGSTGVDQVYPRFYVPRMENFTLEDFPDGLDSWAGLTEQSGLPDGFLAFNALNVGLQAAGKTPVILINEPVFISGGINSAIRYNFFYPRWIYDRYRQELATYAAGLITARGNLRYFDFWDAVPSTEFTDSAVHLTPQGSLQLANLVRDQVLAR